MYYAKRLKYPSLKRAQSYVNDFSKGISTRNDASLTPLYKAVTAYNFSFFSGVLKDGFGVCEANITNQKSPLFSIENVSPKRLYYFKQYNKEVGLYVDYLIVYGSNGLMYKAKMGQDENFSEISGVYFKNPPSAVNYTYAGKNVIIFSGETQICVYDGESVTTVNDAPSITSACIHSERLFVTEGGEKTALWFSDDFDPLNWNVSLEGAGYIDLRDGRGSLLKVISFGGYLYVFRNYGITRVTAYGDQTAFSVEGITTNSSKIIKDSITLCGDRIIYLAQEGFYSFSGGKPTKILQELDGLILGVNNQNAKGCYFGGNYYCIIKIKENSGVEREVLLSYNLKDGSFMLGKDLKITDFAVYEGENNCALLFLCENQNKIGTLSTKSQYFNQPLKKSWISGESDLGIRCEKCVTRVNVNTLTPIKVQVKSEKECKTLYFKGSTAKQSSSIAVKGERFTIGVECDCADCKISYISLEYEYLR